MPRKRRFIVKHETQFVSGFTWWTGVDCPRKSRAGFAKNILRLYYAEREFLYIVCTALRAQAPGEPCTEIAALFRFAFNAQCMV